MALKPLNGCVIAIKSCGRLWGNPIAFGCAIGIPDRLRGEAIRQVGPGKAIDASDFLRSLVKKWVPENVREHFFKIPKEEIAALQKSTSHATGSGLVNSMHGKNGRHKDLLYLSYQSFFSRLIFQSLGWLSQ